MCSGICRSDTPVQTEVPTEEVQKKYRQKYRVRTPSRPQRPSRPLTVYSERKFRPHGLELSPGCRSSLAAEGGKNVL